MRSMLLCIYNVIRTRNNTASMWLWSKFGSYVPLRMLCIESKIENNSILR